MAIVLVHKNKQQNHATQCVFYAVYYNMQDKEYYSIPYRNDKVVQACNKIVTRLQQGCVQ